MNKLEIDAREVVGLFSDLTSKQQKQSYRNALRRAANILAKETRIQLRNHLGKAANSKNWWNGKAMTAGIKVNADRGGEEAKVHIMGDFRLKFFEMGTKARYTTGRNRASVRGKNPLRRQSKAAYRGTIKAFHFFQTAKRNKEKEIFDSLDQLIGESIQRTYNKRRK